MDSRSLRWLLLLAASPLACGGDPSTAGSDAQTDVARDAASDTLPDSLVDVTPDAPSDVSLDLARDLTPADATPDVTPDATPDVTPADVAPVDVAPVDVAPVDAGCTRDDACPAAEHCDPATRACVAGCHVDAACAGADAGAATRCDLVTHTCVACTTDAHCPLGSLCTSNRCAPGCNTAHACPGAAACCEALCVDTQTSLAHCGGCGTPCAARPHAASSCAAGRCGFTCEAPFADCDGMAANGCETDTQTSLTHCGACGAVCAPASATGACAMGRCAIAACAVGFGDCDATAANGCEVDVRVTPAHCGACGRACAAGQSCVAGACQTLRSCADIRAARPEAPSGAYTIDPDGPTGRAPFQVYCDMTSDGGGWTLCLKADGTRPTFLYSSALWINSATLNPTSTNLDPVEAKFESFAFVPFSRVRLAFVEAGTTRALVIPFRMETSLLGVFGSSTYESTSVGRAAWLGLMASPSLQTYCNREGFNVSAPDFTRVRLGILANQEDNCGSPDSRIGIGGEGSACVASQASGSVGNAAGCGAEAGDRDTRVFGYVFVR